VRGADLVTSVVERAAREGVSTGLYGGTPESLRDFARLLEERYHGLEVACATSPPFRPLTPEEDAAFTHEILSSGALTFGRNWMPQAGEVDGRAQG